IPESFSINISSKSSFLIIPPDILPEPRSCFKPIQTCPPNTDNQLANLCSNFTAYRFANNGKIYKNKYCAKCNQMDDELLFNNMPGKIVINLTLSLLFSQIFFLASMFWSKNENTEKPIQIFNSSKEVLKSIELILPCFLSGVFIHYFYLAFFLWSNIMAFDLYQMFAQSTMFLRIYKSSKLVIKYFVYGWVSPVVLIMIMLVKNNKKVSYGQNSCFISS
ncbi:adhesion G- coupled receptor G2-like isoform X1, partial [Brachionus plicatilis]